jgi:hypothetical protein
MAAVELNEARVPCSSRGVEAKRALGVRRDVALRLKSGAGNGSIFLALEPRAGEVPDLRLWPPIAYQ